MDIDIQIGEGVSESIPDLNTIKDWVRRSLDAANHPGGDVVVRVVNEPEMIALNDRYRQKSKVTNVLSFPFEPINNIDINILGDIIICAAVVYTEAEHHNSPIIDRWAHMVIHGTLHLCGYDHQSDAEAKQMERLEQGIMAALGFLNPYE